MKQKANTQKFTTGLSSDLWRIISFFLPLTIVGIITIGFQTTTIFAFATSLMWALSCLISGSAIGFLFGIPKILQIDKSSDSTSSADKFYKQQVNTNLEEISDWLTKIIVGLGLINLANLPIYLNKLAGLLTISININEEKKAFALALIIYFILIGFLFGYLSTRLFLAGAFSRADKDATGLEELRLFAKEADPKLVKEVVSKINPENYIKGLESDVTEESDIHESEVFETAYEKLIKR